MSALVAQAASELEPPAETLLATAEPHYQEAAARVGPNPPHGKIQAVISEWSEKHVHLDYRTLCRRVQALTKQWASLAKYPASAPQSAFVPKPVLVPRGRQQLLPPIAMEFAAFVLGSGQCLSRCAVDGADRELFRMLLWFTRGMDCLSACDARTRNGASSSVVESTSDEAAAGADGAAGDASAESLAEGEEEDDDQASTDFSLRTVADGDFFKDAAGFIVEQMPHLRSHGQSERAAEGKLMTWPPDSTLRRLRKRVGAVAKQGDPLGQHRLSGVAPDILGAFYKMLESLCARLGITRRSRILELDECLFSKEVQQSGVAADRVLALTSDALREFKAQYGDIFPHADSTEKRTGVQHISASGAAVAITPVVHTAGPTVF